MPPDFSSSPSSQMNPSPSLPPQWAVVGAIVVASLGTVFAIWPWATSIALALMPFTLWMMLSPLAMYYFTVASFSALVVTFTMTKGTVQFTFRPYDIIIILSVFSYCLHRALGTLPRWRTTAVDLPALAFFILALTSLWWSHDVTRGLYELRNLIVILPFALVITPAILSSWERLSHFMWFIIIVGAINAAISIFAFYSYPEFLSQTLDTTHLYRLVLVFNDLSVAKRGHGFAHPLVTSIWLDLSILFGLAKVTIMKSRKKRNWSIVLTLFILCGHLSTMSKGAILSLVPTFSFLILMQRSWRRYAITCVLLFAFTLASCFVLVYSADLVKHLKILESQTSSSTEGSSTSDRLKWWKQSLAKLAETDYVGVGLGGVFQYLKPWGPHTHSIYVGVLAELGFPGLFLYLLIFALALGRIRRALSSRALTFEKRQTTLFIAAALINILFYGFVDMYYTEYLVWLLVGLALTCAQLVEDDERAQGGGMPPAD